MTRLWFARCCSDQPRCSCDAPAPPKAKSMNAPDPTLDLLVRILSHAPNVNPDGWIAEAIAEWWGIRNPAPKLRSDISDVYVNAWRAARDVRGEGAQSPPEGGDAREAVERVAVAAVVEWLTAQGLERRGVPPTRVVVTPIVPDGLLPPVRRLLDIPVPHGDNPPARWVFAADWAGLNTAAALGAYWMRRARLGELRAYFTSDRGRIGSEDIRRERRAREALDRAAEDLAELGIELPDE